MRIINILRATLAILSLIFFVSCNADNSVNTSTSDEIINSIPPLSNESQIGNDQEEVDDQGDLEDDQEEDGDDDDQGEDEDNQGEDDDDQGEDNDAQDEDED